MSRRTELWWASGDGAGKFTRGEETGQMAKQLGTLVLVGAVLLWPAANADAQFGIHFGGGHDDDHHGGHHDDHHDNHGIGIHFGIGDHHDYGHHFGHRHDSDWHFVVPHYDRQYHGTYYVDEGINYYVPQTYVTDPRTYVAAKP